MSFPLSLSSRSVQLVPSADGTLVEGNEDLYWKPASSSRLLYDQLSHRKFPEVLRATVE